MGNVYNIYCLDCMTDTDIGKVFWDMVPNGVDFKSYESQNSVDVDKIVRGEVVKLYEDFKEESHDENGPSVQESIDWFMFRAMKIIGFLTDHQGHRIRIDHDNSDFHEKFVEDQDVWGAR